MFLRHLSKNCVEISFVFVVDQTVVKYSLCFVAKQPKYLRVITNGTRISL